MSCRGISALFPHTSLMDVCLVSDEPLHAGRREGADREKSAFEHIHPI